MRGDIFMLVNFNYYQVIAIHFTVMFKVICVFAAWVHGDPRKVIYPTDSYGQFCGQKDTFNE